MTCLRPFFALAFFGQVIFSCMDVSNIFLFINLSQESVTLEILIEMHLCNCLYRNPLYPLGGPVITARSIIFLDALNQKDPNFGFTQ